jgi:hypothetical protein
MEEDLQPRDIDHYVVGREVVEHIALGLGSEEEEA